jgi:hypothetical protein
VCATSTIEEFDPDLKQWNRIVKFPLGIAVTITDDMCTIGEEKLKVILKDQWSKMLDAFFKEWTARKWIEIMQLKRNFEEENPNGNRKARRASEMRSLSNVH